MTGVERGVTLFLGGLITIAVINVLVSKQGTPGVLNAAGGALSGSLAAAQGNAY